MNESVYRDAVTKLRILLEATEAASQAAAEAKNEADNPAKMFQNFSKIGQNENLAPRSRQVNFIGSVDRNIDRFR